MVFIEQNCTIEHDGRTFESGGAIVTPDHIVAYPKDNGVLGDWRGNPIGTWRIMSSWPMNSWMGSHMHQIESTVDGVVYTGRGFGKGMIYRGKRKKNQ